MAGMIGGPSFMKAMTPALRLMHEHSKLVDRTKTDGQQTTVVGNSKAVWEYRRNDGLGDEPFVHKVVEMDWGTFSRQPQESGSKNRIR
jgi:hypothetical protein